MHFISFLSQGNIFEYMKFKKIFGRSNVLLAIIFYSLIFLVPKCKYFGKTFFLSFAINF